MNFHFLYTVEKLLKKVSNQEQRSKGKGAGKGKLAK